jgi:hypothetical protein
MVCLVFSSLSTRPLQLVVNLYRKAGFEEKQRNPNKTQQEVIFVVKDHYS